MLCLPNIVGSHILVLQAMVRLVLVVMVGFKTAMGVRVELPQVELPEGMV